MSYKIRVPSDKYAQYKKNMPKDMIVDCEPVDLYGKRVNLDKNDPDNFEETAEDIQNVYGLKPSVNEQDQKTEQGGVAHETHTTGDEMED